jgi:hypothetical protein
MNDKNEQMLQHQNVEIEWLIEEVRRLQKRLSQGSNREAEGQHGSRDRRTRT